jgi:hypothetical protein
MIWANIVRKTAHPANQCIEALDVTDVMMDRASITCPVEGTCDWIEQHTSYQEWLSSTSKPLCVIGGPGKGKTLLAVHVSLALETASRNEKYTFAYFFCNYQDPNRNSAWVGEGLKILLIVPRFWPTTDPEL